VLLCLLPPTRAVAAVAVPMIVGPITGPGAPSLDSTVFGLAPFGYSVEEFFIAGMATGFATDGTLSSDGKWSVRPAETAAYETRLVVRRPTTRARFNGTVVVEWLNVSAGFDAAPDWTSTHTMLLREGFAWVGVSAQVVGVSGGPPLNLNLFLQAVNPARYGTLLHPGDTFSYDMFSQAGRAIRQSANVLLGDLRPRRLVAIGESQAAYRLVTYINAIHPLAKIYDGFLVHSRGDDAAPLSEAPQAVINGPRPALIRDDIDVPVLTFETETDVASIGFLAARQPDGRNVRTWEVAGTAHADTYAVVVGSTDQGRAALDTTHLPPVRSILGGAVTCDFPINSGPQHYVLSAALRGLVGWIKSGRAPASAPPLLVDPGFPPLIRRDRLGNALGGIRTPQVDVPIAVVSGTGQTVGGACNRFGTTIALDAATLASLYPDHRSYVAAVNRATKRAVRRGWVLSTDAKAIRQAAAASAIGATGARGNGCARSARRHGRDQIVDHGRHAHRGREVEFVDRREYADILARRKSAVHEHPLEATGFLQDERTPAFRFHDDPAKADCIHVSGFVEAEDGRKLVAEHIGGVVEEAHLGIVGGQPGHMPAQPPEDVIGGRIERARPSHEQRIGGKRLGVDLGRQRVEGIVGRAGFALDLTRQPRRVRGEVDHPDDVAVTRRDSEAPVEMLLQRIGELDGAIGDETCEGSAGEDLADRADAHHRITVGLLPDPSDISPKPATAVSPFRIAPSTSPGTPDSRKRMLPVKPTVSSRSSSLACAGGVEARRSALATVIATRIPVALNGFPMVLRLAF
jgi:hypothetical protein